MGPKMRIRNSRNSGGGGRDSFKGTEYHEKYTQLLTIRLKQIKQENPNFFYEIEMEKRGYYQLDDTVIRYRVLGEEKWTEICIQFKYSVTEEDLHESIFLEKGRLSLLKHYESYKTITEQSGDDVKKRYVFLISNRKFTGEENYKKTNLKPVLEIHDSILSNLFLGTLYGFSSIYALWFQELKSAENVDMQNNGDNGDKQEKYDKTDVASEYCRNIWYCETHMNDLETEIEKTLLEFSMQDQSTKKIFHDELQNCVKYFMLSGGKVVTNNDVDLLFLRDKVYFNVPEMYTMFCGRHDGLKLLGKAINNKPSNQNFNAIVTGESCVGKTQLTRKYIEEEKFDNVIFVREEFIEDQLKELAEELNLIKKGSTVTGKSLGELSQSIFRLLNNKKTILIYDNASNVLLRRENDQYLYIPNENNKIKTIIITRHMDGFSKNENVIELKRLGENEKKLQRKGFLLLHLASIKSLDNEIDIIICKNFIEAEVDLQATSEYFKEKNVKLLWQMLQPDEDYLATKCSYSLVNVINKLLSTNLLTVCYVDRFIDFVLDNKKEMIENEKEGQDILRVFVKRLYKIGSYTKARDINNTLLKIQEKKNNNVKYDSSILETRRFKAKILNKLGQCDKAHTELNEVNKLWEDISNNNNNKEGTIKSTHTRCKILINKSKYNDALEEYKNCLPDKDPQKQDDTLIKTKIQMAELYRLTGEHEKSESIFTKILSRATGDDIFNRSWLKICRNFADLIHEMGRNIEALCTCEFVLKTQEQKPKENCNEIIKSKVLKAVILASIGRFEKSLTIFNDVLKYQNEMFAENHPDTLKIRSQRAKVLCMNGKYDESYAEYDDIIKHLAESDSYTLETKIDRALVITKRGKHAHAKSEYKMIIENMSKRFGRDHPKTLKILIRKVKLQLDKKATKTDYKFLLENRHKVIRNLSTNRDKADVYNLLDDCDKALHFYHIALETEKENSSVDVLETLRDKAMLLYKLKRYQEALNVYKTLVQKEEFYHQNTLKTKKKIFELEKELGLDSKFNNEVENTHNSLEEVRKRTKELCMSGKGDEAISFINDTLNKYKTENHPDTEGVKTIKSKLLSHMKNVEL